MLQGQRGLRDSWALISSEGPVWRSCSGASGEGGREGSNSDSVIEKSVKSLTLKVGGLNVFFSSFDGLKWM